MCGRYVSISKIKTIEKRFNVTTKNAEPYVPNTNISHTNLAPVITDSKPKELQFFQFGFTPSWSKKQVYLVNARAEGNYNKDDDPQYLGSMGIISKPMFRKAIRSQRCLVPADAFIEGPKKERLSKPFLLHLKNGERPFAFAGIWDEWVNIESGEIIPTFAIITTVANKLLLHLKHHRSPVILNREDENIWIDPNTPLAEITSLLRPYNANLMNAYPISPEIKSPKANGLHLLEPIGERVSKEFEYSIYDELKLEGMGTTTARKRADATNQGQLF